MSMVADDRDFSRDQTFFRSAFDHLLSLPSRLTMNEGRSAQLLEAARKRFERSASVCTTLTTMYVAQNWNLQTRLERFLNHRQTVKDIGGILDVAPDAVADLIRLSGVGDQYRITLDRAVWFRKEGQLVFSLWDGIDRIFSIAFCLSTEVGKRIVYIGAIQGRREPNILERYKMFSKAAHGMRTRDFMVEIFKIFCKQINVSEIRAVAMSNKYTKTPNETASDSKLCYDDIWRDRGGIDNGDGFFILPMTAYESADENRAPKKRANYQKRYAMLAMIENSMGSALQRSFQRMLGQSFKRSFSNAGSGSPLMAHGQS